MKPALVSWLSKFKRRIPAGGRRRLRSVGAGFMRIGTKMRDWLRDEIQRALRSPIKSIGRLGMPVIVVATAYIFLYNVFSNDVFIDDVEIQGNAKERGFTGEILTQSALASMPAVARNRLGSLPAANARFLQLIDRRSDNFETERLCYNRFPLLQSDYNLYLAGLPRAEMSSKTPDQIVSSQSLSIKKLAYWTRNKIGLANARQLKPLLYTEGDRLVMKVIAVPSEVGERKQTFDKIDDAPRVLAAILLDFLSPELLATETAGYGLNDPDNFVFPLNAADQFLSDRQKKLFILNVLVGTQLEASRFHADRVGNYIEYLDINRMILDEADFRRYGDLALFLRVGLSERIMMGELFKARTSDKPTESPAALQDKHLGKYRSALERTAEGRMLLMIFDVRRGDMNAFHHRLDRLLDHDIGRLDGGRATQFDVISFVLALLFEEKRFDEARALLGSPRVTSLDLKKANAESAIMFRALRAVVQLQQGDPVEYESLVAERFGNRPCIEWMATALISDLMNSGVLGERGTPKLIETLGKSFGSMEQGSLKSFVFYNLWGSIEQSAGKHESAYQKYEQALRFEGDHAWALLNWGGVALNAGQLDLARKKYTESLELGTILNAVSGLLVTLVRQEDGAAYLDTFDKYGAVLKLLSHAVRSDFERNAIIFSCRLKRPLTTTVLNPDEGILFENETFARENLIKEVCASVN